MAVEYVGPFQSHRVVVDGWTVPFIAAHPQQGGRILLSLDRRVGVDLDLATAELVLPFIANAIAIAAGYAGHPSEHGEPRSLGHAQPRRLHQVEMEPPLPN
jgi:hypothetical protein